MKGVQELRTIYIIPLLHQGTACSEERQEELPVNCDFSPRAWHTVRSMEILAFFSTEVLGCFQMGWGSFAFAMMLSETM